MFVAIDTSRDRAVTGLEIRESESQPESRMDYQCPFCDSTLIYMDSPNRFKFFTHPHNTTCINAGNVSDAHRLAQEVVAKQIIDRLPVNHDLIKIDLERHIGSESQFVITDVRITEPIQLAVEVVYLSPGLDLQRRLRTLFAQGYAGMVIVVADGRMSPGRIEHHLRKVCDVHVGRFDPQTGELRFGSVMTPDEVDLNSANWDNLPACLS
jgi:hypothetical protein